MKAMNFLLIVVLMFFACTSNVQQETQTNTDTNEQPKYTIYLDDFEPSGFTYADFIKLQEIANRVPERLDTIPKDIAYRLTSQDTNDVEYFCMWIDIDEKFPLGCFLIRGENYATKFYITFSKEGDIIDYLVFKSSAFEVKNDIVTNYKDYTYETFFFCEDCFPETIEYFAVKTLDTSEEFAHPHLAKVLKTDNWYIDENGKFKLRE